MECLKNNNSSAALLWK